jgi:hypothetical protein
MVCPRQWDEEYTDEVVAPDASSHAEQRKELDEAAQRARAGLAAVKLNDAQLAGTQVLIAIRRSSISMK